MNVSAPAATAFTPANFAFVPVSTKVFNNIQLQQEVMKYDPLPEPGSTGQNGFKIHGYTYIDENGIGSSRNNFWLNETSDGIIDVSGISYIFSAHSQGLSKNLSFLNSVFGFFMESGVVEEGRSNSTASNHAISDEDVEERLIEHPKPKVKPNSDSVIVKIFVGSEFVWELRKVNGRAVDEFGDSLTLTEPNGRELKRERVSQDELDNILNSINE